MENNIQIRKEIFSYNLKKWKIAELLGITDSTFSKMLRKELSKEQKNKVLAIIEKLKRGEE